VAEVRLSIIFLSEARAEFDEAYDWYESKQTGLGRLLRKRFRGFLIESPLCHACTPSFWGMCGKRLYLGFLTASITARKPPVCVSCPFSIPAVIRAFDRAAHKLLALLHRANPEVGLESVAPLDGGNG